MVNEEILGALKSALTRGESLKKAMMTLYNAGYKKEEISKAASFINKPNLASKTQPTQPPTQQPTQQPIKKFQHPTIQMLVHSVKLASKPQKLSHHKQQTKQPQITKKQVQQPLTKQLAQPPPSQKTIQKVSTQKLAQPPPIQKTTQKVSAYKQPPKKRGKTIIIVFGFLLLLLVGILVAIFVFKKELIDFFSNIFG